MGRSPRCSANHGFWLFSEGFLFVRLDSSDLSLRRACVCVCEFSHREASGILGELCFYEIFRAEKQRDFGVTVLP